MRINEITTKNKQKTAMPDLDVATDKGAMATTKSKTTPQIKKATKAKADQKIRNIEPINAPNMQFDTPSAAELERDERDFEPVDLKQPEPELPKNALTVISKELSTQGYEPEWIEVKHLPGYMQQGIRLMGRAVFSQFTNEKLENIQVMTTLTHQEDELKAVANWLIKNGNKIDTAHLDFQNIESYGATVKLWRAKDYDFLLVTDFAGKYIYTWNNCKSIINGPNIQKSLR